MSKAYYLDGSFHQGDRFEVAFDEPFFAHGHGLFETLRTHEGRPCFLKPHVQRLRDTALKVGMELPVDEAELRLIVAKLLEMLGCGDARVKLHLLGRLEGRTSLLVSAVEIATIPREFPAEAVTRCAPAFRDRGMAGLKTMNYMSNRLAEAEGRAAGFGEVLFVGRDDLVHEGTRSTVFAVFEDELYTPPLDLPILPGVTRLVFLHLARELGMVVREEAFSFERMKKEAQEVFLVASVSTFRPVGRIDDRRLDPVPGPRGRALVDRYLDLVASSGELPES
jgi:branched-subunit amino acid aminotransferase/4-amino-4-deoxychorismate lyase